MKRDELILNKLYYNNRFVLFFSIILAIIIWLIVALLFSPEDKQVIKNVPVKIDLSNSVKSFDLQIFGTEDFFIDITVVGKRYIVSPSSLSADDFSVIAKTNYVDSAGKQTLQIEVKPKAQSADYSITDISDEYIEVYFDVFKEGEYTLTPELDYPDKIVPDGYFKDTEVLSAKTVTISGAASEINKISEVVARAKIDKTLTSTKTVKTEIVPLGEYGGTLRYLTINGGNDDISVTISVFKLAELPISVSFKNVPPYYLSKPLKYSSSPPKALFAVNEVSLETMTSLDVAVIDFSNIKSGENIFIIKSNDIVDTKVMDKTKQFIIVIDTGEMSETDLTIKKNNISISNIPTEFNVLLKSTSITKVTVFGPPSSIKTMTADDIFADVDLSGIELSGDISKAEARIFFKNHDDCWAYRSYNVGISVTPKQ